VAKGLGRSSDDKPYDPPVNTVYHRNFDEPDEVIELEQLISKVLTLGGMSLALDTHQPGWHWKKHVRPVVGTDWCESRHIGYAVSGRMAIEMRDGTKLEARGGDAVDIPPGHDAWVVGDETCVMVTWMGGTTWLAPLRTLKDRVLVTLLYTDIVDSTGTALRLGDQRWLDLLAAHNQRTSDAIDRYRGRLIKFTGDGALALFDGAVRAVKCALACHRDAAELGLTIRAGVHTGEVEVADEQVQGLAIHEAQRIMAHADSGEVLVSATTMVLARDPNLKFENRGEVRLRGLDELTGLYRVSQAN
jgi:class 3 adenylate cyclase